MARTFCSKTLNVEMALEQREFLKELRTFVVSFRYISCYAYRILHTVAERGITKLTGKAEELMYRVTTVPGIGLPR